MLAGLDQLFFGTEAPGCADAADVDDNGKVDLSDSILMLNYLFLGAEPPQGGVGCGEDDSADDLGCESAGPCDEEGAA